MLMWVSCLAALLICILIVFVQIAIDVKKHSFDLFNVKYAFQLYYILILPFSGMMYSLGNRERVYPITENRVIGISVLVVIGLLMFWCGNSVGTRVKPPRKLILPKHNRVLMKIENIVVVLMLTGGYLITWHLIRNHGGIKSFFSNIEVWRNTGLIGNGIYLLTIGTVLPLAGVLYIISLKEKNKLVKNVKVLFMAILTVVPSLLMGFRGMILGGICMLLVSYNYTVKKITAKQLLLCGGILFVLLMGYGIFRGNQNLTFSELARSTFSRAGGMFEIVYRVDGYSVVGAVLDKTNDFRWWVGGGRNNIRNVYNSNTAFDMAEQACCKICAFFRIFFRFKRRSLTDLHWRAILGFWHCRDNYRDVYHWSCLFACL